MPRQFEAHAERCIWFVAALKRAERIRFSHSAKPPFSGRCAGVAIMITAHQHYFNVAVPCPEVSEAVIERCCVAGSSVYQITQDHKARCFMRI